ncbi:molecular chaperone [Pseudomonas alkylphenolica]|uniref:fimbrial biogenesis chaperone n=1 Tax=Pseudomonas alkylphenolica TaxID=237609 RepID=UPI0018D88E98|nr:molecular chaperone [Pseudomonas alkylphenolica]MBH3429134.1 molecular chaperone [Pseudomonas alkylphenolica]
MRLFSLPSLRWPLLAAIVGSSFFSTNSWGGLMLSSTRLVFDGSKRDTSITASNSTPLPYAVQVWINNENDDNSVTVPFVASPALFRLDAKKEQIVRVQKVPGELPQDRESVFYLNAQEIPQASAGDNNTLKIAIRTRIKLFYRPAGLKGQMLEALPTLNWTISKKEGQSVLSVENPSAFHLSFAGVQLMAGDQVVNVQDPAMVAPMSSQHYPVPGPAGKATEVQFSVINDYGGYSEPTRAPIRSALPAS